MNTCKLINRNDTTEPFKIKFKRYKICLQKKEYYIFIPEGIKSTMWACDFNDWWYNGCFLDFNLKGAKILNACFALLSFNPHAIIYLNIRDDPIPKYLSQNPKNGRSDILFMTEQSRIKESTWIKIRNKLKRSTPTVYKFKYDINRMRKLFEPKVKIFESISGNKICNKARADNFLFSNTIFYIYPIVMYQENVLSFHSYFFEEICDDDIANCYMEDTDSWVCNIWTSFSYNARDKANFTDESPYLTLYLELYDVTLANKYLKSKDKLISSNERNTDYFRNERYMVIKA